MNPGPKLNKQSKEIIWFECVLLKDLLYENYHQKLHVRTHEAIPNININAFLVLDVLSISVEPSYLLKYKQSGFLMKLVIN